MKQFSIISESLRFKQSNFLFGSMTGSVISGQIVVRSGDLGANFVIYGSKKQIGFIEINSTSAIRGRVGGITLDTPGARSVSAGGDFNRDRRVDYLVGDPVQSKVYVISVVSGLTKLISRLSGKQGSGFGWAVSSIADFNSDGVDDFIVSALYESRCFIIFGSKDLTDMSIDSATLPPAIGVSVRVDADDSLVSAFAVAVASVRDLNGDGWPDIAMSAQMRDGTSTIYILFGSANLFSSFSQTALSVTIQLNDIIQQKLATKFTTPKFSFVGVSMDGVGDMNGDGYSDLILGSVPFSSGYKAQRSYLLYGASNISGRVMDLSSMNSSNLVVIEGAGFLVSGINDVNDDGLPDAMVTSYPSWAGSGSSYIISYPTKVFPETSQPTSMPTSVPTLFELSIAPTNLPSISILSPTSSPSIEAANNTNISISSCPSISPTISLVPTVTPSRRPTKYPSIRPTQIPSFPPSTCLPSVHPSIAKTVKPSRSPTLLPSTPSPSFTPFPSSRPTAVPSGGGIATTPITVGGKVEGVHGNEVFIIRANENIMITGKSGKKTYVIHPAANTVLTITDFKKEDVIDLTPLAISLTSLSYITNPLTISLPNGQKIVLSSHAAYDLTPNNFVSHESGTRKRSSMKSLAYLFSKQLFATAGIFVGLLIFIPLIVRSRRSKKGSREKKDEASLVKDVRQIQSTYMPSRRRRHNHFNRAAPMKLREHILSLHEVVEEEEEEEPSGFDNDFEGGDEGSSSQASETPFSFYQSNEMSLSIDDEWFDDNDSLRENSNTNSGHNTETNYISRESSWLSLSPSLSQCSD